MSLARFFGYGLVFIMVLPIWFILGGVNEDRSRAASNTLSDEVSNLFGSEVVFEPPSFNVEGERTEMQRVKEEDEWMDKEVTIPYDYWLGLKSTRFHADVEEQHRSKGLVSFRLFTVVAEGAWTAEVRGVEGETLTIRWRPPAVSQLEDLMVVVDGAAVDTTISAGQIEVQLDAATPRVVLFEVAMKTRGRGAVGYRGTKDQLTTLSDLDVGIDIDNVEYDFPSWSASPTTNEVAGDQREIRWQSSAMVTDRQFVVSFEDPVQPGQLATRLAFSAPWSLFLFVSFIGALSVVKEINFHPMHLVLTSMGFFSFNLLFSYMADVLGVWPSFALSAIVSVGLVTTYLSKAVSPVFGYRAAGLAQLVFLIGFAFANMWEGLTGLSITITGTVTLAAIMQLTARVDWSEVFSNSKKATA